jgi:hypothetical protein
MVGTLLARVQGSHSRRDRHAAAENRPSNAPRVATGQPMAATQRARQGDGTLLEHAKDELRAAFHRPRAGH